MVGRLKFRPQFVGYIDPVDRVESAINACRYKQLETI